MTFDVLSDLNWLAVIVATIAYFALGGLWYSPVLFAKVWTRASGTPEPAEGQSPGAQFYVVPFICNLLASVATAMIAAHTGASTVGQGIVLGLVVGVGYAASLSMLEATFGNKPEPRTWFMINAGYHLIGLTIVAVLVTKWD